MPLTEAIAARRRNLRAAMEAERAATTLAADLGNHPCLRDRPTAIAPHSETWLGPDALPQLESASDGGSNKELDNPHCCQSEALFAYLNHLPNTKLEEKREAGRGRVQICSAANRRRSRAVRPESASSSRQC